MKTPPLPEERLEILRALDTERKWYSLDDKRGCVICNRVFTGRQIDMTPDHHGGYHLHCPTDGCPSNISHWFFCGSLLDGEGSEKTVRTGEFGFLSQDEAVSR